MGDWETSQEAGLVLWLVVTEDSVWKWELDGSGDELLDVWSGDAGVAESADLDDLDGSEAGAMAGSHVLVELVDGSDSGDVTELLVDVVGSSARVVSAEDSEVLDLGWLLLVDLDDRKDLSGGGLDLLGAGQEVPEARLGVDWGWGEDLHSVDLWGLVGGGRSWASNDLELIEVSLVGNPSLLGGAHFTV